MQSEDITEKTGYLTGQLLIAMPAMLDSRFEKTVIYMCIHNVDGAMGLVINRRMDEISFPELLQNLNIDCDAPDPNIPVQYGGPVETGRGFVLHTEEYEQDGTISVHDGVRLTATIEILAAMADRRGPMKSILALGYAGWGPGQLDSEIQQNAWLHVPADEALLFDTALDGKWDHAIAKIGVDVSLLSGDHGHA
jgi:putative transcriptional regulator